jgi:rhodanese-related sulfurtransferase
MSAFSQPNTISEVDAREARRRLEAKVSAIIDVRESYEWDGGHIPGATHLPLSDLQARAQEVFDAPDVIFVCASGGRSAAAAEAFQGAGHPNVASLVGGMSAWQIQGLPIER